MTTITRLLTLGVLLTAVPCLAGQKSTSATQKPASPSDTAKPRPPLDPAAARAKQPPPATADSSKDYVIGPSDVLEIAVWNNEAVSRTVPVRPDGKISLQLINDVQAAGLTPMQLRATLTEALTAYVQNPEISVIVREVHSFKVSVMGEVKEPGRFDLSGRVTVLDVLAMAKGLTEYADKKNIAVLRREAGVTRTIPVEYHKLVSAGESMTGRENFFVQPDDIVLVR